jgi:hypothetical protein
MKKLVLLLSVVAVSYALQAGDGACSKDKAACEKSKGVALEKAKADGKESCAAGKKVEETAKKPVASPKTTS